MENDTAQVEKGKRGRSGNHSVTRWSPTKEQIGILESMYTQGIRTPNAEQIQQITSRLRAYGHIEGKNVFYWFQNHKARQRQKLKQKQQCIGYSNRFVHASSPISQNVVCAPYWFQQNGISFYAQQPKMVATGVINPMSGNVMPLGMPQNVVDYNSSTSKREALTLFPLHPTGVLEEKTTKQVPSHADTSSVKSLGVDEDHHSGNQPFIDFFTSEQRSRGKDQVSFKKTTNIVL